MTQKIPTIYQGSQWLLSIASITIVGILVAQGHQTAIAKPTSNFNITPEQRLTARQVATLLDRSHYLNQPLDKEMGQKMLSMYLDTLDPSRTLFLQSDINEFKRKYNDDYAIRLKQGDLSAGVAIFERYLDRSIEYYDFAQQFLSLMLF